MYLKAGSTEVLQSGEASTGQNAISARQVIGTLHTTLKIRLTFNPSELSDYYMHHDVEH
jgi:hypothetical protein